MVCMNERCRNCKAIHCVADGVVCALFVGWTHRIDGSIEAFIIIVLMWRGMMHCCGFLIMR